MTNDELSYKYASSIEAWFLNNVDHVRSPHAFVSNHIDEIIVHLQLNQNLVSESLEAFAALVSIIRQKGDIVQPMLAIPLEYKYNYILREVPSNLEEIVRRRRAEEPPSLYLLPWDAWVQPVQHEEYRCPLPFDILHHQVIGINSYYREFRNLDDMANDWEFTGCVYVAYYSARYSGS